MSDELMNGRELPRHWGKNLLSTFVKEYISGGTPSTKDLSYWDGGIAWTTSAPISEEAVVLEQAQRYISQSGLMNSSTHVVPKGSLLVGTRVGVGKAVVNAVDIAISQDLTGLVLDSQLDAEFAAYQFKTAIVQQYFDNRKRGTTIKGISRFDLASLELFVPPLPEQRAIAHTLRTVQAAREARRHEAALERTRKAALMQRLFTRGTRGEPTKTTEIGEVPASWEVVRLGEVVHRTQYGLSIAGKAAGSVPILRMNSLSDGGIAVDDLQYVDLDAAILEQFKLNKGDLLFNRTNSHELVGKTGLFELDIAFVFASYLVRVTLLSDKAEPAFFNAYLNWTPTQQRLKAIASRAVSQSNINATKLVSLLVPLPALSEQGIIAAALRACDEKIAALEREAAAHDELFRALLEELMTGRRRATELVER